MPIDSEGNRADIVMDAASTISRMNIGRLYEHYLAAACRDIAKEIRKRLGITTKVSEEYIASLPTNILTNVYDFLLGFYYITSQRQYDFYTAISPSEKIEHITSIVNDGIYLYLPVDNDRDSLEMVQDIEKYHRPTYGPVSYVGNSGVRHATKNNVRIAPLYMMLLEKIADDWCSVSSAKLQHFGVLATMTKSDKYSFPYRNSPVRTIGETEARIFVGYCGREAIAEMMDRSNNPITQRNMVWNILNASTPSNIDQAVDRNYIRLGANKPLQLIKHVLGTAGFKLIYKAEDDVKS